jgi:hypothetical protein
VSHVTYRPEFCLLNCGLGLISVSNDAILITPAKAQRGNGDDRGRHEKGGPYSVESFMDEKPMTKVTGNIRKHI